MLRDSGVSVTGNLLDNVRVNGLVANVGSPADCVKDAKDLVAAGYLALKIKVRAWNVQGWKLKWTSQISEFA